MRVVLAVAIFAVGAGPAPAQEPHGHQTQVVLSRTSVAPADLSALPGDEVKWLNGSSRTHTVTSADGLFDARLSTGRTFVHRFDSVGSFAYFCRIHPNITGRVTVRRLLVDEAPTSAVRGERIRVAGRAGAGIDVVSLEADGGDGFRPVGGARVDEHGVFVVEATAGSATTYRVSGGGDVGDAFRVEVTERRRLSLAGVLHRRRAVFTTRALPAKPGATVVLQVRLRERFGWWPVRWARLDDDSRARFTYPRRRSVTARAVLVAPDGATVLSVSGTFRILRSANHGRS